MDIKCVKSNGYKWCNASNVFFKGYIQKEDGTVLRKEDACLFFSALETTSVLKDILKDIDGVFAVIIYKNDKILAATDVYRSFPLYYSADLKCLSDSSEEVRKMGRYNDLSVEQIYELYATGIVAFSNTVLKDIKQISQGCLCEFQNGEARIEPYFSAYSKTVTITRENALKHFKLISRKNIEKLRTVVNGRQIAVSLSSGYDSRYLVMQLKEAGINNVICFSYGRSDSFEVSVAKSIAEKLGYHFIAIHCTKEKILKILEEENMFSYCISHDYSIYLQNYVAIKELTEKKLIADDAVIMTGIICDAPVGFYVPSDKKIMEYELTNSGVAKFIVEERFGTIGINADTMNKFVCYVKEVLEERHILVKDEDSFVHAANCIMIENEQTRAYYRMNDIHEFFGHEYLFPFITKEMLIFWLSLPRNLLYGRSLYSDYINNIIGEKYGLQLGRKSNVPSRNKMLSKLKRKAGGILVKVLYCNGIHFSRKTDINAISYLEPVIAKRITQKKAISAEHANLGHLMNIFLMEKKYGTTWYSKIMHYIK